MVNLCESSIVKFVAPSNGTHGNSDDTALSRIVKNWNDCHKKDMSSLEEKLDDAELRDLANIAIVCSSGMIGNMREALAVFPQSSYRPS